MEKDDAIKAVSTALATLLSATACSASSPANPNTSPNPSAAKPPVTGKYVGEGAKCTVYTLANGVSTELANTIIDPVMDSGTLKLLLPNGGDTTLFNCTEAKVRIPVSVCRQSNTKDSLSCQKVGGGTVLGSIYAPPPRKPGDTWHEKFGRTQSQHQGAGWSTGRRG